MGKPYDTLEEVIGIRDAAGSLKEFGVSYRQVDLLPDGSFDYENIRKAIHEKTKLVEIQRSKGYATRPTLSVSRIGELIRFIKGIKPDVICMVDNCYGEFVERIEPTDVGADMIVGSLIKNPGGGLAPIGGYIVGRKDCIELASYRLTAPGLGKEVGASLGVSQSLYQGLFLSPTVVAGALKGAIFAANVYERLGFPVSPNGSESRHDIIQAVTFGTPEGVIKFCEGIQAAAPVDSYVTPEPWAMPGYDSDVIMAAGGLYPGFLHRAVRRRPHKASLCRLFPGRPYLVSREAWDFNVPAEAFGRGSRNAVSKRRLTPLLKYGIMRPSDPGSGWRLQIGKGELMMKKQKFLGPSFNAAFGNRLRRVYRRDGRRDIRAFLAEFRPVLRP